VFIAIAFVALAMAICFHKVQIAQNIFIGIFTSSLVVLFLSILSYRNARESLLKNLFNDAHKVYMGMNNTKKLFSVVEEKISKYINDKENLYLKKGEPFRVIDDSYDECIKNIFSYNQNFFQYSNYYKLAYDEFNSQFANRLNKNFKRVIIKYIELKLEKNYVYMSIAHMSSVFYNFRQQRIPKLSILWSNIIFLALTIENGKLQIENEKIKKLHSPESFHCRDDELISQISSLENAISELNESMKSFITLFDTYIPEIKRSLDNLAIACGVANEWVRANTPQANQA
jgi:hypothetical protein